jgi:CheY-like chemotaxis protein
MSTCGSILLVDDEAPIRLVVGARLRSLGYTVLEARDGEEGLRLAREHKPALILSDLQMPHMSGLELCLLLHEDASTASIPALLLTSRGYVLSKDQLEAAGIRELMSKPFSVRDVVERIQRIIGPARTGGQAAA